MNYDIIAMALNRIADAHNYAKVTESLRRYVNNPELAIPDYINEYSRVLIKLGRDRPLYFVRLMEMVEQIRMGTGDPELYTEKQWREVDDAIESLFNRDRPTRLISAIKDAADTDLPWKSALQKTELKPFASLVRLYRGSPAKFEDYIKIREYLRREKLRTDLNERRKGLRDRRAKLTVLVQFKNKWFTQNLIANEVDQLMAKAMEMRHLWVKRRPQGTTAVNSSNEYWKLYDVQLDDALAMVDRAKKGASVIAKEVKYPIVDRSRL